MTIFKVQKIDLKACEAIILGAAKGGIKSKQHKYLVLMSAILVAAGGQQSWDSSDDNDKTLRDMMKKAIESTGILGGKDPTGWVTEFLKGAMRNGVLEKEYKIFNAYYATAAAKPK